MQTLGGEKPLRRVRERRSSEVVAWETWRSIRGWLLFRVEWLPAQRPVRSRAFQGAGRDIDVRDIDVRDVRESIELGYQSYCAKVIVLASSVCSSVWTGRHPHLPALETTWYVPNPHSKASAVLFHPLHWPSKLALD